MNKFRLTCQYCNFEWEINYTPQDPLYCGTCSDRNIRIVNLATSKIDYYAGSPPFPEKNDDQNWNF